MLRTVRGLVDLAISSACRRVSLRFVGFHVGADLPAASKL